MDRIVFNLILGIIYVLIGTVITLSYSLLSGGLGELSFPFMLFSPIIVYFLTIIYTINKKLFMILLLFLCFPIVLNGFSILTNQLGYKTVSNIVFKFRFDVYWTIPLIFILIIIFTKITKNLKIYFRKPIKD